MTSIKKNIRAVVCTLLSLLLILTMVTFPSTASAIGISKSSFTLTKGYSTTLKITGNDSGAAVSWSTSDKTIATVSSTGKVVGKSIGTATITANVGGTQLTSTVKVVGGKLAVSSKNITIDEGSYKYITVRAKGSHGLKVQSGDKNIVTASWIKPWENDDIRLRLTGKNAGTTTVKIYLTKYPDVAVTLNVTVGSQNAVLLTSQSNITTKVNSTASVVIYSDKDSAVNYTFSDSAVAKVTEGTWKDHYCTLTVTGLKAGTTTLTLTRKDNAKTQKTITVNVTGADNGYYTVLTTAPEKQVSTDTVYRWTDPTTKAFKYMLLPVNYDVAKVNSIVAKDSGVYDYYSVYESTPSKKASTDSIKSFSATVNSTAVTRYVIVPVNYDVPTYETAIAVYSKSFKYWTIYNTSPESYKLAYTDVVKTWSATVDYKAVTRYVLLPLNYSQTQLEQLIASDTGSSAGGYYSVSTTQPTFKASTDQVIPFQALVNNSYITCYILVPANYDEARVNDAKAKYIGKFEYWAVYTTYPTKQLYYDVIEQWTKTIDSQVVTRYMLLPQGYDTALFQQYKNQDMATSNSAYYSISTTYPTLLASTDIVWMWYNTKSAVTKYMLLPAGYDVLKRNDIIFKDTGTYDYYTIYSTSPTKKLDTDIILTPQYLGGTVYMLVPKDWDQNKVNMGLAGLLVSQ